MQITAINSEITLQPILLIDHTRLMTLMENIYLHHYRHMWTDGGVNYLSSTFSQENLEKELNDASSSFYFVHNKLEMIGILRIMWESEVDQLPGQSTIKVHRLYLSDKCVGKGIGKLLVNWVIQKGKEMGKSHIWLESMATQRQAVGFYYKMGFATIAEINLDLPFLIPTYKPMLRMCRQI